MGLGLPEAGGDEAEGNSQQPSLCGNTTVSGYIGEGLANEKSCKRALPLRKSIFKHTKKSLKTSISEEKEKLVIELIKTEIHLRRLQALKLEKELGLPLSSITENLVEEPKSGIEELHSSTNCSTSSNTESTTNLIPLISNINSNLKSFENNPPLIINVDSEGNIIWNQATSDQQC